MDPMFPLLVSSDASRDDAICQILKHCYKYGVAPPLTLSQEESLIGDWQRIANALNHELYDKISSAFIVIVNGNEKFQNMNQINELLEELKNERHIHQHEINYIRQLIERATHFYTKNHGTSKPNDKQ
eukprot:471274_1